MQILRSISLLLLLVAAGCSTLEKRVDLTYHETVGVKGGSGMVFVAQPVVRQSLPALISGAKIVGKAEGADIVINDNPGKWLLSALVKELSAAGYDVRTVQDLPPGAPKGVEATIVALSANQSTGVFMVTTVTEIKLEARLTKDDAVVKTLSASVRDHDEGTDRSPEPIRVALERTLQRAMRELIPDIVTSFE